LDAGCGTGLCGPLIAPFVRQLIGVDLSAGMLAKARGRGVYDDLVKAELTAYLVSHPDTFDLIVSADTLVYFGSLEEVLGAANRALKTNGLLIFTVESGDGETIDETAAGVTAGAGQPANGSGYRINPHGRYSHSRQHLQEVLTSAGFDILDMEPAILRTEGGVPVMGIVVTARKADTGSGSIATSMVVPQ